MSLRPSIPAVEGVADRQVAGILGAVKTIIDSITGREPNRQQIKSLGANTSLAALTNKINEVVARLQGTDIATPAATASGAGMLTNSLTADVALNNTANYFDGPSVSQGSTGTWFVSGSVVVNDTVAAAQFFAKLWDGTTVIASTDVTCRNPGAGTGDQMLISLSGIITNPSGNLRISARDPTNVSGVMLFNASGNFKDSTITAIRIG